MLTSRIINSFERMTKHCLPEKEPYVKHGGGSIMMWSACFAASGSGRLVIIDEVWGKCQGNRLLTEAQQKMDHADNNPNHTPYWKQAFTQIQKIGQLSTINKWLSVFFESFVHSGFFYVGLGFVWKLSHTWSHIWFMHFQAPLYLSCLFHDSQNDRYCDGPIMLRNKLMKHQKILALLIQLRCSGLSLSPVCGLQGSESSGLPAK